MENSGRNVERRNARLLNIVIAHNKQLLDGFRMKISTPAKGRKMCAQKHTPSGGEILNKAFPLFRADPSSENGNTSS